MKPTIMAHGGAWDWDDALDAGKKQGIEQALAIGNAILERGGSALDAVERTVIAMEDNPVFDAGHGGYLNEDGVVQLDAMIIDGEQLDFGALAGATRVKNPIILARKILTDTQQCFLAGAGVDKISQKLGLQPISNSELVTSDMLAHYEATRTDGLNDTVGAIAIDSAGNIAAATSTSGTPRKPDGRVGDSPIFGAGAYAENGIGAAGATGQGEQITRLLLSKLSCDAMSAGMSAADAAKFTASKFEQKFANSMSGVILIDASGNIGFAHTAPKMAFGCITDEGVIKTATSSSEMLAAMS